MAFTQAHLQSVIKVAIENSASDIHIRMDETPCLRIRGDLIPVKSKTISANDIKDICLFMFQHQEDKDNYEYLKECDGIYEIPEVCRVRYNFFRYNGKVGIILRIVQMKIPTIDELNLSSSLKKIARQKRGLVLVTGATGSGKSTTLAAMIDYINEKQTRHIVTIEDPIEYLHSQKNSRISQREIGTDTKTFDTGLRAALRQDPDVILIGELRDNEAVSIAMKAAETGHLVFATVHTTDAISTIGRIIAMFPPEEQADVRKRLAENLSATISQRMLKGKDKSKVLIAQEIMVTTPGVKECIRGDEPLDRIYSIIENGYNNETGIRSQAFDQHIYDLYRAGLISESEAEKAVSSSANFLQKLIVD